MTRPALPPWKAGTSPVGAPRASSRTWSGGSSSHPLAGTAGIGHTRWATHGKPNETNAHPHASDRVAVVHNGIIENFSELREELKQQGFKFESETDTEVVAHLVTREMKKGSGRSRPSPPRCRSSRARSRSRSCSRARRTC